MKKNKICREKLKKRVLNSIKEANKKHFEQYGCLPKTMYWDTSGWDKLLLTEIPSIIEELIKDQENKNENF